jgi:hypothetical protein
MDSANRLAFVRASEVHRLVGSAATLRGTLGDLPCQDFRETLAWMLTARRGER